MQETNLIKVHYTDGYTANFNGVITYTVDNGYLIMTSDKFKAVAVMANITFFEVYND